MKKGPWKFDPHTGEPIPPKIPRPEWKARVSQWKARRADVIEAVRSGVKAKELAAQFGYSDSYARSMVTWARKVMRWQANKNYP
jgi:hypothetical protein